MDAPKQCLIDRWVLEYEVYELWKKFSDNLRITQTWQMMYYSNFMQNENKLKTVYESLGLEDQQDDTEIINLLLLKIMTSISSASKLPADSSKDVITPLEEALMHVDQLFECKLKEVVKNALLRLRKAIKQESVIICLRCHKLNLGKSVYERVWNKNSSIKDFNIKVNMEALFKDDINLSSALNQFSVSELSDNCKHFFSKYFNTFSLPFLNRVGEKFVDSYPSKFGLVNKKKKLSSEVTKYKHFLIQCWLAEYISYLAWKNVDELLDEKFEWMMKFVSENNDFESKNCLLIRFMFKYNERNKNDETIASFSSPSELCLELLEKMNISFPDAFDGSDQLIGTLKSELKRYAVLIWCSRNMYSKAKTVFEKLFADSPDEQVLTSELNNILNGSLILQDFSDKQLDQALKNYLEKVFSAISLPYLLTMAENVINKSKSFMESLDLTVKKSTDSNKRHRTSKKLPNDFVSSDFLEDFRGQKGRKLQEFKKNGIYEPSEEEDFYESFQKTYSPQFDYKEKQVDKIKVSDLAKMSESIKTNESKIEGLDAGTWQEDEEELIYRGSIMFGVGKWDSVAQRLLIGRSGDDVKKKWTSMIKTGKLKTFIDLYGPIPCFKLEENY
ncbi:hypothetical protein HELRODRAFT_167645 [Helobdella robusta]|uniref:Uncharacterized protein n=1 Tax=Helobdella robusta TaxID=6412 RepID=T1EZL9_HELRO|nr:hypothetical protein HELRODRAFT_167645 [Helobdella robusta]ESO09835.1 hypothetical protein HELRODRAFT_167645 [Helobdella robusta]